MNSLQQGVHDILVFFSEIFHHHAPPPLHVVTKWSAYTSRLRKKSFAVDNKGKVVWKRKKPCMFTLSIFGSFLLFLGF